MDIGHTAWCQYKFELLINQRYLELANYTQHRHLNGLMIANLFNYKILQPNDIKEMRKLFLSYTINA